jgi:PD-(D/E)XK nuclease superfamily
MKLETHSAPGRPSTQKEWSWSYSKLKNYDVCPKRMYEVDIAKTYADGGGEALTWGNSVHDALAKALKDNLPLPAEMASYQYWVDRVRRGTGELLVEQKYAITRQFQKTTYFAKDVWYRGIGDVVRLDKTVALVLDWKTGKILEDSVQLMLMAQCLFSHFPALTHVRSSFVWLKDDCETPELLSRQEVAGQWVELMPRVLAMEQAAKDMNYPPKPGYLCKKYCPVTSCPFHGKGAR